MSYYILDPNDGPYSQPKPVYNEDPHNCTKKVDHWEFWLYRRNQPLNGIAANRWGMIYDRTLDQAQHELEQGQQFEIAYAKFFHKPENSEVNTYFNSLGPIAFLGSCYPNGIADKLEKFMKGITVAQALFGAIGGIISGKGASVGAFHGLIDSYGNAVQDGINTSKRLSDALIPGLTVDINAIGDIVASITNIDQQRQDLITKIDTSDVGDDMSVENAPYVWNGEPYPEGPKNLGDYGILYQATIDPDARILFVTTICDRMDGEFAPYKQEFTLKIDEIASIGIWRSWYDKRYIQINLNNNSTSTEFYQEKRVNYKTRFPVKYITTNGTRTCKTYLCKIVLNRQDDFDSLKKSIEVIQARNVTGVSNNSLLMQIKAAAVKHDISNPNIADVATLNTAGLSRPTATNPTSNTLHSSGTNNSSSRPAIFNYTQYPRTVYNSGDVYQGQLSNNDKHHGHGKYMFKDGRTYEGQWRDGKYHGYGKFNYNNGQIYEGEFVDNQFQGRGRIIYPNSDFYDGEWQNNQRYGHGEGRITFDNGHIYEGQWLNNKFHGQGKYIWPSGQIQEGQWRDSKMQGHGTMKYSGGEIYDGQWTDDRINGQGKYTWPSGQVQEGQWRDGKIYGQGTMKYADGRVYEGQWQDDKRHGHGRITRKDGGFYEGQWQNDLPHGQGKDNYADGGSYEGQFQCDKRHGYGKYTFANGNIYDGQWQADQRVGRGVLKLVNGQVYDGEWKDDIINGQGECRYANSDIYNGEWVNDKCNGRGRMKYSNGNIYEGNWVNGQRVGYGEYRFINGDIYKGQWVNDQRQGEGQMKYRDGKVVSGTWINDQMVEAPSSTSRTITQPSVPVTSPKSTVSTSVQNKSSQVQTSKISSSIKLGSSSLTPEPKTNPLQAPDIRSSVSVSSSSVSSSNSPITTSSLSTIPTVKISSEIRSQGGPSLANKETSPRVPGPGVSIPSTSVSQRIAAYQALISKK
jgi:hypothetical protein